MTGMGFTMGKGLFAMLFARALNSGADLAPLVANLRNPNTPAGAWAFLDKTEIWDGVGADMGLDWGQLPDGKTVTERIAESQLHFRNHWLATHRDPGDVDEHTGYYTPADVRAGNAPADAVAMATTGWWLNWSGDAEAILREGLLRAIEASRGIASGAQIPHAAAPATKVDFQWLCGGTRFECWVNWERNAGAGRPGTDAVQMTLLTPGIDPELAETVPPKYPDTDVTLFESWDQLAWPPGRPPEGAVYAMSEAVSSTVPLGPPWGAKGPVDTTAPRGLVVVGHRRNLVTAERLPTPLDGAIEGLGEWFEATGEFSWPTVPYGTALENVVTECDVAVVEPSLAEQGLYKPVVATDPVPGPGSDPDPGDNDDNRGGGQR